LQISLETQNKDLRTQEASKNQSSGYCTLCKERTTHLYTLLVSIVNIYFENLTDGNAW